MGDLELDLHELEGAVEVALWVQPRAPKDEVGGTRAGALRVRISAPPVEGRANEALLRTLARALDTRPSAVTLLSGERGRRKRVRIKGVPRELRRRLLDLAGCSRVV